MGGEVIRSSLEEAENQSRLLEAHAKKLGLPAMKSGGRTDVPVHGQCVSGYGSLDSLTGKLKNALKRDGENILAIAEGIDGADARMTQIWHT